MAGTTLSAVVRIVDLPVATTVTGAELLEVIQTASGVGLSVQVSLNQIMTSIGGVPSGGGTSQILGKSSGSNYSTAWYDVASFITVGATTGLQTTGSGTGLIVGIASGGVSSTRIAANAVQRANLTAFAIGSGQVDTSGIIRVNLTAAAVGSTQIDALAVLRANVTAFAIGSGQIDTAAISSTQIANNSIGTNQLASSIGIASSVSVGTLLTVGGTATITGTTILNGGLQVSGTAILTGTFGQVGTSLMTGQFGVVGTSIFTSGAFGVVGTSIVTGSLSVIGSASFTGGTFGVNATSNFTGVFNVVGTSIFTGVYNVNGTTLFTSGTFGVIGTTLFTSTFGIVGTSQLTGTFNVVGTSIVTGTMNVVGTTNVTGAFILGNLTTGVLVASGTGVVSSQGGMVLLNTLSPNNVASTNDTTSFSATYRNYMIMLDTVCPATQTTTFQMTLATTGSAFTTSGYVSIAQINVSSVLITDTSTSALLISGLRSTSQLQTSTVFGVSGFIKFFNPSSAVNNKTMVGVVTYPTPGAVGTTTVAQADINGVYQQAAAVTGINFAFSSGNIQTGTIKIFGIT